MQNWWGWYYLARTGFYPDEHKLEEWRFMRDKKTSTDVWARLEQSAGRRGRAEMKSWGKWLLRGIGGAIGTAVGLFLLALLFLPGSPDALCLFYVCLAIAGPIGFWVGVDPISEEWEGFESGQYGCYVLVTSLIPAAVGTVLNWVFGFSGWFVGETGLNCAWAVCVYFATTVVFLVVGYAFMPRDY